jgi:cell division protein FtsB
MPTRAERRHQLEARRTRTLVIGAVAISIVVLVAWFPASALLSDRRALATVTTQLDTLRRQDQAITQESARLSQPAEIERIARQQFQMVPPGAQEYQVLPKSNSSGGAYASDPGLQRPVAPSGSAQLLPGTLTDGAGGPGASSGASAGSKGAASGSSSGGGLLTRIVRTLEFWR